MKSKLTSFCLSLVILLSTFSPALSLSILPSDKFFVLDRAYAVFETTEYAQVCTLSFPPRCKEEPIVKRYRFPLKFETYTQLGSNYINLHGFKDKYNYNFKVKLDGNLYEEGSPQVKYSQTPRLNPEDPVTRDIDPPSGEEPGEPEILSVEPIETFPLPFPLPVVYKYLDVYRVGMNKTLGNSIINNNSIDGEEDQASLRDPKKDPLHDKQTIVIRTKESFNTEIRLVLQYRTEYTTHF